MFSVSLSVTLFAEFPSGRDAYAQKMAYPRCRSPCPSRGLHRGHSVWGDRPWQVLSAHHELRPPAGMDAEVAGWKMHVLHIILCNGDRKVCSLM